MNWLSKLFYKLSGGRPMNILSHYFTDAVTGEPVYRCRDKFGRRWMANGKWSWFRVRLAK